jgi:hypothetical protein
MIIPPTAPVKTATQTFIETPNSLTRMYAAIINNIEDMPPWLRISFLN